MNEPSIYISHAVVKQAKMFYGKRAGDYLEWQANLRTVLSLYNRPIFNVLEGGTTAVE